MLRTLRAWRFRRMLNSVLVVELVSLALVAGLVGSSAAISSRRLYPMSRPRCAASMARRLGQLTRREWWIAGIAISI
jgi:putative ABC transport system permease protein